MIRLCKVQGCAAPVKGYGVYCSRHKAQDRRHGAPNQRGITKADLKLYRAMVSARIEKNQSNPLWAKAEQRWLAVVRLAEGVLDKFASGKPGFGWERKAAIEVVKLAQHVTAREVVETVIAVYLMQNMEPGRFRSDRGFQTQLVRRVRGLTEMNAGKWRDPASGKVKRAYSELPPRVTAVIGTWLVAALGGAGVYLARLERQKAQEREQESREFAEALEGLR